MSQALPLPEQFLTTRDVARMLRVPLETVYQWRKNGEGPPAARVGKHLRYHPDDVAHWFRTRTQDRGEAS